MELLLALIVNVDMEYMMQHTTQHPYRAQATKSASLKGAVSHILLYVLDCHAHYLTFAFIYLVLPLIVVCLFPLSGYGTNILRYQQKSI